MEVSEYLVPFVPRMIRCTPCDGDKCEKCSGKGELAAPPRFALEIMGECGQHQIYISREKGIAIWKATEPGVDPEELMKDWPDGCTATIRLKEEI